jgi:hypothetical protein
MCLSFKLNVIILDHFIMFILLSLMYYEFTELINIIIDSININSFYYEKKSFV